MIVSRAEVIVALGGESLSDADQALLDMLHPLAESAIVNYMQAELHRKQHIEFLPIGSQNPTTDDTDDVSKRGEFATFGNYRSGSSVLQLKHTPVITTGLEVREDVGAYAGQSASPFPDSSILTLGTDYYLDLDDGAYTTTDPSSTTGISRSGKLHRYGVWPNEPRCIKVTYWGGFSDIDLNRNIAGAIKSATLMTIITDYKEMKEWQRDESVGPATSESIGKYSRSGMTQQAASLTSFSRGLPHKAIERLQPFRNYGRLFA